MRADVCSLAAGDLMVQLLMEEIEVPLQPIPVVGDQGVLMFPRGDDVRLDLARLSRERTNMELDGFVLASAVMSIAKALGYNPHELRAACAHELSTCGTPLLRRSPSAENYAERQAAQETLADMLHDTPEPLRPVPAIWARQKEEETGATLKVRLGAYQREEDAAYAYAAGAFVIRRKDTFFKVMELNAGEMAALEGCIEDDVRHLVHKRQWYRWREWRKAMDDIGVKPGTPFELEKSGKSNPQAPRHGTSVDAPGEAADADGESVEVSPGEGSDASSPEPNPPDAREGKSSSSHGTATNRRKEGPSSSVGNGRSARPEKRRKVSDLPDTEEQADAPPQEPEPESSDDNPNEALPRVNAAADDEEEETNEELSDSAPVTRDEFDAMRKTQKDTAATLARLETALLASLANHTAKKRKRDNARGECERATNARKGRRVATPEESDLDEDEVEEEHWRHMRSSTSPVIQRALKFPPSNKGWKARSARVYSRLPCYVFAISKWSEDRRGMPFASGAFAACARAAFKPRMINGTVTLKLYHMAWLEHVVTDAIRFWETRKGRLSNSAGVNAQIVDGLRECALTDVMAAVDEFQPAYDATISSWAWGRHGLRLSSCGIERQATAAPAASESGREGDNLSLN
ncbi:unnamed protein product [Closterium sp. Naga37s-1]|nr:unnamed protein product [Closterium sp. Naga37s-1]